MQLEALEKKGRFQQMFDDAGRIQTHGLYEQCTSIAGGIMSRPARLFKQHLESRQTNRWSGGATAQHLLPMYHKVSYIPVLYKRYSKVRAWYSPVQWLEIHCWWWWFFAFRKKGSPSMSIPTKQHCITPYPALNIRKLTTFYLTHILTFYLTFCHVLSGIRSGINSDILSGIYSDVLSDIYSTIWQMFWHFCWPAFLQFIRHVAFHLTNVLIFYLKYSDTLAQK